MNNSLLNARLAEIEADIDALESAGGALTVKDEGATLSGAVTSIDFVGGEVTATGAASVTVTIPTVTSVSGNAGTATALQTAHTIAGVSFNGTADIAITTATVADSADKRYCTDAQKTVIGNTSGTNTGDQTSVSGNAGTATALQNARTIAGVSFNGTANIAITTATVADSSNARYCTDAQKTVIGNTSGTNTGDQTTVSGNAGTATALQNARTIDGTSFNGTANINILAPSYTAFGACTAGWTKATSNDAPRYYKQFSRAHMTGYLTATASVSSNVFLSANSLPAGYRPLSTRFLCCPYYSANDDTWYTAVLLVQSDGAMNVLAPNNVAIAQDDIMYLDGVDFLAEQ